VINPGPVELYWNPKQSEFFLSTDPFVNLEGGFRAGKSYVLCWKILVACCDYPGIICALTRWTQDGLDAQLKPEWRKACGMAGIHVTWNATEEYDELPNGSRVYLRALKASEDTSKFGKLAGLEFSIIGIDQAEEVPEDVYRAYVPARLSQTKAADGLSPVLHHVHKTPPAKQVLITPNPPANEDHWICKTWPTDEPLRPGYVLIRTTMYDNAGPLGSEYIATQELSYVEGSPEYRRFVLGERGITTGGDPIFGGHFDETVHARTVQFNPELPLYESIDYGTRRPCITWQQYWPGGILVGLGGVMGQNMLLEEFLPLVAQYRAQWFPGLKPELHQFTCDPAGATTNSHGTETGLHVLWTFDIHPTVKPEANYPPVKDAAIQKVNGYLIRRQPNGSPCFLLDPRFVVVSKKGPKHQQIMLEAFRSGYIYDHKRNYLGTTYPHLRPAKKDGFYEHPCDTFLYGVIAFAPSDPAREAGVLRTGSAIKEATRLMQQMGMVPSIPLGEDPEMWARAFLAARAQSDRERLDARARKAAQRDYEPTDGPRGSDGYFGTRRGGGDGSLSRGGY
jgi:hypothetical protein